LTLPVETLKSVPRGKAVWNVNGGFVSVLLTHLFVFSVSFVCIHLKYIKQHPHKLTKMLNL